MDVSIITVNYYNTKVFLYQCIKSIQKHTELGFYAKKNQRDHQELQRVRNVFTSDLPSKTQQKSWPPKPSRELKCNIVGAVE